MKKAKRVVRLTDETRRLRTLAHNLSILDLDTITEPRSRTLLAMAREALLVAVRALSTVEVSSIARRYDHETLDKVKLADMAARVAFRLALPLVPEDFPTCARGRATRRGT